MAKNNSPLARDMDDNECDFCLQFLALMKKHMKQKLRDVIGTVLEIILPILFVVGSVVLWSVFDDSTTPGKQFLNYSQPSAWANASQSTGLFRSMLCVNTTTNPMGIAGIRPCNPATPQKVTCFPHDDSVPVEGLCFVEMIPGMSAARYLQYFVYGTTTEMFAVPSLDDMIALQWVTRLTIADNIQYYTATTAISTSGRLYFAPNTAATASIVGQMNASSTLFSYVYGGTLETEAAAVSAVTSTSAEGKVWGIVVVNSFTASRFDVSIRLNHTAMPQTDTIINKFYLGGIEPDNQLYIANGFFTLQNIISKFYLENVTAVGKVPDVFVMPMGYADFAKQTFLSFGGTMIPLLVVLGYLYPVSQVSKRLVVEKELRIREAMMIMGLGNGPFYLSWTIVNVVQQLIIAVVSIVILKATYLTKADGAVLFFCFFFFGLSAVSLGGLISSLFSKSRIAAIVTPLVYFATAIPLFVMTSASASTKRSLLILSPTTFSNGVILLFQHELGGGLGSAEVATNQDDPNMITILIMLAFDTILYFLLWLYADAVMPSDWGTPRSCCYCITDPIRALINWCRGLNRVSDKDLADGRNPAGVFEDAPVNDRTSVRIVGLRKEFERGGKTFVAVNNLYWTMQEGEISVLLGHNGAGKSTAMNMMTGMLEADDGDCYIYGHSVRHELDKVRREIGYCPQHNVLWPELTCEEHLNFYATVKGLTGEARDAAVTRMLVEVDLVDKRSYLSSALSGGQKRKLSVAIAFVGGSRLVFLDEPTAGMDVGARRHTWDLLRKMSATHTILLTTHFMDEADLLGHSIGIMSAGSLQCSGSSLFLKSRLGVGYNIVLSIEAHANVGVIGDTVKSFVEQAEQLSCGAGEVSYRLPSSALDFFPGLLAKFEENGASLGVRNFSISATTLEEIFLQIAHGEQVEEQRIKDEHKLDHPNETAVLRLDVPKDSISSVWNVRRLDSGSLDLFLSQLSVLMTKRFRNSMRDRRTQCLQIVTPVLCILLAMLFTLINIFAAPPIELSPAVYGEPTEITLQGCSNLFGSSVSFPGTTTVTSPSSLQNALNLSNYLVANAMRHGHARRYSAMSCEDSLLASALGVASASLVLFNTSTFHELPIGVHGYYSSIYNKQYPSSATPMRMVNDPMPMTARENALTDSIKSIMIGIIIMIPFTFIPSTFVAWVVKERECKARHLQNVSGLGFGVYWLSNFLFDLASFCVTVFLAIMVFLIFNRTEYVSASTIGPTIVLFLFYGLAAVVFSYAISFFFEIHSTAQNIVMLGNFIAGFLLVLVVFILSIVPSTKDASVVLAYVFRLVPSYCLGDGIINLALMEARRAFGDKTSIWDMSVVGWDIVYLAIEFPVVFALTLFIDHPARRMKTQALLHDPDATPENIENEENDVQRERQAIEGGEPSRLKTDLVVVKNLRKVYDNGKVAVKNLSFGVHAGEVFGFLGTNGAGKTTAISILCQEFFPTSGRAYIVGHDIVQDAEEALRCIGYCPQFDALLDLLTVEEHLYLYAGIRGIVMEDRSKIVASLAELCELTKYLPTVAGELSGGNKRKLSVALSLIGGPSVVFLDEPSAGMDPMARRGLWTAVQTVADNCAVVLTTHHLEEVEALAHRVAIMVDGSLRCIGDKTHLKTKYGSGFELSLRLGSEEYCSSLEEFIRTNIPAAKMDEYRSLRYTYSLPQDTKLSVMFGLIQQQKGTLNITDYSISQTSIEQVFLRISAAAEQADE